MDVVNKYEVNVVWVIGHWCFCKVELLLHLIVCFGTIFIIVLTFIYYLVLFAQIMLSLYECFIMYASDLIFLTSQVTLHLFCFCLK